MCSLRNSIYLPVYLVSIVSCACLLRRANRREGGKKGKPFAFRRKSINWWSCNYSAVALVCCDSIFGIIRAAHTRTQKICAGEGFPFVLFFLLNQNFSLLCFIYLLHRGVGRLNDVHPSDFGRGVSKKTRLFRTKSTLTQHGAKPARR